MMKRNKGIEGFFGWLLSPWAILAGMLLGIVIGIFNKTLASQITPFGNLYLALIQMCVLPIMVGAVISSLGGLLRSEHTSRYLFRMAAIFLLGLLIASTIGLAIGLIGRLGSGLDRKTRVTMGKMLTLSESEAASAFAVDMEISISEQLAPSERTSPGLISFFDKMIPQNIFAALSEGQNLKVLFFSIVLGMATAFISANLADSVITGSLAIFKAFEKVIAWAMYGLPIGLCCLLASQISAVGIQIILATIKFIAALYIGSFLFILLNGLIIWLALGGSVLSSFKALKETLLIALGTRSSFASMPSALRALHEELGLEQETTNLVIPLGITLCRYGTVMMFALSSVFFAQLYGISLGVQEIFIILIGAVLTGMASAGSPGVVSISMLALIFDPLGLPISAAIVLLLAIDPITDPILTVLNVHANCAATALIAKHRSM